MILAFTMEKLCLIACRELFPVIACAHAGDHVAVAVSGGADSVCLLHVLHELAPALGIQLSVAHLNHKLRGSESDADADVRSGIGSQPRTAVSLCGGRYREFRG